MRSYSKAPAGFPVGAFAFIGLVKFISTLSGSKCFLPCLHIARSFR